MSVHQEQARELIDLVADAMDGHESRKAQYDAGRRIILAYQAMHPLQHYAVHQASLYLVRRLDLETA